jgi:Bifunctional DNA primase/polymerase, N-terminal
MDRLPGRPQDLPGGISMTAADANGDQALFRAALSLAARGWHVFPCVIGGKEPALRDNWQHLATISPARVHRWWNRLPYNIGISCGSSGLAVLDLDVPHRKHPPACEAAAVLSGAGELARLCHKHGQPLPHGTFTVRTPSGGYHLYFTVSGTDLRNSAGKLATLIDVRAAGGYVVGPGSRVRGRKYVITYPAAPLPLPDWIAGLLRQPCPEPDSGCGAAEVGDGNAYALAALRAETRRVATAQEGARNDTLNRAAFSLGQLVAAGMVPQHVVRTALANAAAQAGLPTAEAARTIRSGMTAGAAKPRRAFTPVPGGDGPLDLP